MKYKKATKMNIFALHPNPRKAARWHVNQHVVKMLLETCQLLYTAHWVLFYSELESCRSPAALSKAQKQLEVPEHVVVARDIIYTGNTSAASIPLAMHALLESGEVKSGGLALEIGFGAGLAFGAQVVVLP
jgi:hypothetical protein